MNKLEKIASIGMTIGISLCGAGLATENKYVRMLGYSAIVLSLGGFSVNYITNRRKVQRQNE